MTVGEIIELKKQYSNRKQVDLTKYLLETKKPYESIKFLWIDIESYQDVKYYEDPENSEIILYDIYNIGD